MASVSPVNTPMDSPSSGHTLRTGGSRKSLPQISMRAPVVAFADTPPRPDQLPAL